MVRPKLKYLMFQELLIWYTLKKNWVEVLTDNQFNRKLSSNIIFYIQNRNLSFLKENGHVKQEIK